MILEIKCFKHWSFQKMSLTKNVPLKQYSSTKNNFRKIHLIFLRRKLTLKGRKIGTFWLLNLELWYVLWKCLKGYFWSVAKVALWIWCRSWNSNLKSYLYSMALWEYHDSRLSSFVPCLSYFPLLIIWLPFDSVYSI